MDELEIVVVHNPNKNAMFSGADRVKLWQDSLAEAGLNKVEVSLLEGGLLSKQVAEPVRGATLIGKGYEVLPKISMIADDLELAAGICGASSGMVPTTVGQPTLKIDSILVGGR